MVDPLLALQRQWVTRADELLALGAVDWRRERLPARIADVVQRYRGRLAAVERRRVELLVDALDRRLRDVEQCGVPDTVVHGDFHPGNLRGTAPDFVILDWGEVGLGHPMLDQLSFCGRLSPSDRTAVEDHWVRRWQQFVPGTHPARAASLLRQVRSLMDAVIYQDFPDNIEPDERRYHLHDPLRSLREAITVG
jgi:aminoglycoside phosphotransferase (APT) family kinase protein